MKKYVAVLRSDGDIDYKRIKVFKNDDDANKYIIKCFVDDLLYFCDYDETDAMEIAKDPDDIDYRVYSGYISYRIYGVYYEYEIFTAEEV